MSQLHAVKVTTVSIIEKTTFTDKKWSLNEDIVAVTAQNEEIAKIIKSKYPSINVESTMSDLLQCTNLFQVSLTAARNDECSTAILTCISGFQNLVANSEIASAHFISACLQSLKLHSLALIAMDKGKTETAFKAFGKCAKNAEKMSVVAATLEKETDVLICNSEAAMSAAQGDKVNQAKALQNAKKAKEAAENAKALHEQDIARQREAKANAERQAKQFTEASDAAKAQKAKTKMAVTAALTVACPPAGIIAGIVSLATSAGGEEEAAAAAAAAAAGREAFDKEINAQRDLQKSVQELAKSVQCEDTAKNAVQCMGLCVKTLVKIKSRFAAMKTFWGHVAGHCIELADTSIVDVVKDLDDANMFADCFVESGKGWAALGLVSLSAHDSLVTARNAVRDVLENLPSGDECPSQIQNMCDELLAKMKDTEEEMKLEQAFNQKFLEESTTTIEDVS